MAGYGKCKTPAAKPQNRQKTPQMQRTARRKKPQKRGAPLVERQKICYTISHDAPSPSGKAGDFDSPIVGSTPAGATRKRPLHSAVCSGLFCIRRQNRLCTKILPGFDCIWGRGYYNNKCFLQLKQQRMQET